MAGRYADLVQRVLDEFAVATAGAGAGAGGAGNTMTTGAVADGSAMLPRSVAILADMRRCAVDLDALIERAPRVAGRAGVHGENNTNTPTTNNNDAAVVGLTGTGMLPQAKADLEFLDVFDFFNYPRLPAGFDGNVGGYVPGTADWMPS